MARRETPLDTQNDYTEKARNALIRALADLTPVGVPHVDTEARAAAFLWAALAVVYLAASDVYGKAYPLISKTLNNLKNQETDATLQ